MKKVTPQQKLFVKEYIKTLDGEKSLKSAGYKARNLKSASEELLSKDSIINEIKRQINLQIESLNVQKGYVIHKLLKIAEFSLQEEDILDKEGFPTGKKKLRDSGAGLKALESLCKYLGFSDSKSDQDDYREAKIITISNLDDEKI